MSDFERRLRESLSQRAADPVPGEPSMPQATRRRVRVQRVTSAMSMLLIAAITTVGATTLLGRPGGSASGPVGPGPMPSITRQPFPATTTTPSHAPISRSTPPKSALTLVGKVPQAGVKIVAHGGVWVVAPNRLFKYSLAGKIEKRLVASTLLGSNAVLETQALAADGSGLWLAGSGAGAVDRTLASGRCASVQPAGGDRDGDAFVVRINARTLCPTSFIKLGTVQPATSSPGLIPPASASPSSTPASRYVRWHGIAFASGSLWIGAEGGMLRVDLESSELTELGMDAHSVGAGFGSVWAAIANGRGTANEENFIARIDPATNQIIAKIEVPPGDRAATDFNEVYVGETAVWAEGWGVVSQIAPATNEIAARFDVGGEHLQGDMAAGRNRFFLADSGSNSDGVWAVDTKTGKRLPKIQFGSTPQGLVVAGGALWFTLNDGGFEGIYRLAL